MTATDQRKPALPAHHELRTVFGTFATGVTVVTSGSNRPHGMTANAFTSVSLDPALVLVCIKRSAVMHATVQEHGSFVVSILASGQEPAARYFANSARPRDDREFDGVPFLSGPITGAPILIGSLAWLECGLTAVYDGGDHSIFLGSVLGMGRSNHDEALLFHGGRFATIGRAA